MGPNHPGRGAATTAQGGSGTQGRGARAAGTEQRTGRISSVGVPLGPSRGGGGAALLRLRQGGHVSALQRTSPHRRRYTAHLRQLQTSSQPSQLLFVLPDALLSLPLVVVHGS